MKGERCLHPFDSAQGKTFGRHNKWATPCDEPHKRYLVTQRDVQLVISTGVEKSLTITLTHPLTNTF